MSLEAANAVLQFSKSAQSVRLVLLILAHHANRHDAHKSWPSIRTIALEANLSERQVKRILRDAEELGELHVVRNVGQGHFNEYFLLLPGLPPPPSRKNASRPPREKGVIGDTFSYIMKGDIQGEQIVSPEVNKGVTGDTQTERTKNGNIPPSSPKGELEDSDLQYWKMVVIGLPSIGGGQVSERDIVRLSKLPLPPRADADLLLRFYKAESPTSFAMDEESQLLRERKRKVSTLIRHLPEMMQKARRFATLRKTHCGNLKARPRKSLPPPSWDWQKVLEENFIHDGPYAEGNEYFRRMASTPWADIPLEMQHAIVKAKEDSEAAKAATP